MGRDRPRGLGDVLVTDPAFRSPEFREYLGYLEPIARGMARKRARPHACLGREDLLSVALEMCLHVWVHYRAARPGVVPASLYPIAVCAMDRGLRTAYRRATKYGEAEVTLYSLDTPSRNGDRPFSATLATAPRSETVSVPSLVPSRHYGLERELSGDEATVLREMTDPSAETVRLCAELWSSPERGRRNWPTVRAYALAHSLGWPITVVRRALSGLASAVRWESSDGRAI